MQECKKKGVTEKKEQTQKTQKSDMAGRPAGSKNKLKEESKSMEKYVTGGEEIIIKAMERIGKTIEESIGNRMERMIEQFKEEWKEEKLAWKEEWMTEKSKLERRLENLEWEKEKRDREKWKNNIIIRGINKWKDNRTEQEAKEMIKENLKIEVEIRKAFKIQARGNKCVVVAELENWEQKREIMIRKKDLKAGIYIDNDLTKTERRMQEKLREKAKEEKRKGNNVKISYGKILIKDKWFRWNEREEKLEEEREERRGNRRD